MLDAAPTPSVGSYLENSGIKPYQKFTNGPLDLQSGRKIETAGTEKSRSLREKLESLANNELLCDNPVQLTVEGTLFPCALLSTGWWEKKSARAAKFHFTAKNDLQRWLFHGFRSWAPSWDFTWNFDNGNINKDHPYFVAQLGDGDEADSVPVLIPHEKARKFISGSDFFGLGYGVPVKIKGVFGHRKHFDKKAGAALRNFGGLLDYCLWLDADNKEHTINPARGLDTVYSGYLWKCVTPVPKGTLPADGKLAPDAISLKNAYFVWDHTDFACPNTVEFNLETLDRKEEAIIERVHRMEGNKFDWVMLQKSSPLVKGKPALEPEEFYRLFYR